MNYDLFRVFNMKVVFSAGVEYLVQTKSQTRTESIQYTLH